MSASLRQLRHYFKTASPIYEFNIGHAVMLSPPNKGSELVDKLNIIPFFKLINGEAGLSLGTEINSVPNSLGRVNFDLSAIIGDRSYNPFYSYLIPGAFILT